MIEGHGSASQKVFGPAVATGATSLPGHGFDGSGSPGQFGERAYQNRIAGRVKGENDSTLGGIASDFATATDRKVRVRLLVAEDEPTQHRNVGDHLFVTCFPPVYPLLDGQSDERLDLVQDRLMR